MENASFRASSERDRPPRPKAATRGERLLAGLVSSGAFGVLLVAAWLTPSSQGHGTHEQLGMLPCSWAVFLDKPCPTCGMTTAFAHAAEGNLLASLSVQPFGALLAILTAAAFWGGLHIAATGSRLGRIATLLLTGKALWIAAALVAIAWLYKIATWTGAGG